MVGRAAARAGVAGVVLLGAQLGARAAAAQTRTGSCDGKVVSSITVHSQLPYTAGLPGVLNSVVRAAVRLHTVTRPHVVEAFLALRKGTTCSDVRLRESERILRDLPFLVAAEITAADDGPGRVRLDVFTIDEISFLISAGVQGRSPFFQYARLGDANFAGQGLLAAIDWREGFGYRDHYGVQLVDYETFGRPYGVSIQASRDQLGGGWRATYVHPFYSDLQHIGWLFDAGETRQYIQFLPPTLPNAVDLDFSRHFAQMGGVLRLGRLGHLTLYGVTISQEREEAGSVPIITTDSGPRRDTTDTFARMYAQTQVTRLNVLWGIRDIEYVQVHGFDALTGAQDLAVGVQFGSLVGHSFPPLSGLHNNDLFSAASLYGGWGNPHTFIGFQASGEAREDLFTSRWDGILTSARLAWYLKPAVSHTIIVSSEFGAGLHQRLPFALTLSDPDGGVRGYGGSHVDGGIRSVTRLEERWSWGPVRRFADVGMAAFVDVGQMWAADVPFGTNTSAVGAGFSLLAAVPLHSKRLLRVDFAWPITRQPYSHFQIRFSTTDRTGAFYIEPRDLARARERTVPTSIFQFPQSY